MLSKVMVLALFLVIFIQLQPLVSSTVLVTMNDISQAYGPGTQYLESVLRVTFNEYIPKTAWLYIFIDGESVPREQISLDRYLHDESYYTFVNQTFDYNVTVNGVNRWEEYDERTFSYTVSVSGYCGNSSCYSGGTDSCQCQPCTSGPPYPCYWSMTTGQRQGSVNGNPFETGLKYIYDASNSGLPLDADKKTIVWQVSKTPSSPTDVSLVMMAKCGSLSTPDPYYFGELIWPDGWVFARIASPSDPCPLDNFIPGTFDCRLTMPPFDERSFNQGFRLFDGPDGFPHGGIYKSDSFENNVYQRRDIEVDWDGMTDLGEGQIIIMDYDSNAIYDVAYLPPNGPMVCAYTTHSISNTVPYSGNHPIRGISVGYANPYSKTYTSLELSSYTSLRAPDCPITNQDNCMQEQVVYSTSLVSDPSGSVDLDSIYSSGSLIVTAAVDNRLLSSNQTFAVDLTEFDISISDLTYEVGEHTLTAVIKDGLDTFGENEFSIYVCEDSDADGYCTVTGDCDDDDYFRNPGKTETCDGLDNDCDGIVDEDIAGMGEQLGQPCNDWPGSMCEGTFVCNPNGTDLMCMPDNGVFPGDREEVCDNKIDDDCDGTTDESGGSIDGIPQPECLKDSVWCIEGQERACGDCKDGKARCVNGKFGQCIGDSSPKPETCNKIDDDCDDIVDNVYGEGSVDGTSCQCYNGGLPKPETCNSIDDDCDGQIDENAVNCCIDGNTMQCGRDEGACEYGIKNCKNGQWGTCIGGIEAELFDECCDYIDNDCDGVVDNGCLNDDCDTVDPATQQSMIYWIMIGVGGLMLLGVLFYVGYIQKKRNSI